MRKKILKEEYKHEIERLYQEEGLSQRKIGEMYGAHQTTVSNFMCEHELKTRSSPKNRVTDEECVKIYEDWLKGVPLKELKDKYYRSIQTIKQQLNKEYNKRGGIKEGDIK